MVAALAATAAAAAAANAAITEVEEFLLEVWVLVSVFRNNRGILSQAGKQNNKPSTYVWYAMMTGPF